MCNLNEAMENQRKEQKKIRNQRILYVAMFIVGMLLMMGCKKEEIKPVSRYNSMFQCNEKSGSVIFKVSNGIEKNGWCKEGENKVEFNSNVGDTIDLIIASSAPKYLESHLLIDGVEVECEILTPKIKRYIRK